MPTKFRLPNFLPIVKTKVIDLTRRNPNTVPSILSTEDIPASLAVQAETPAIPVSESEPDTVAEGPATGRVEVPYKGGHHEQAQDSEISFNHRLSALERYAVESAQAQAAAGLPRMNVETPDELPIETQLRARGAEMFIDWKSRAVRRTQDALQRSVIDAGCGVVSLRHAIDQARLVQFKATKTQQELAAAKVESVGEPRSIQYERQIPLWAYITLVLILMAVEWVANVAVFRALLPIDQDADRNLRALTQDGGGTWYSGLQHLAAKFAVSPEAGILAVGTIFLLMFAAHACGAASRKYLVTQQKTRAEAGTRMISEARQSKSSMAVAVISIFTLLIFLTAARYKIGGIAEAQYNDAHTRTENLKRIHDEQLSSGKLAEAQDTNRSLGLAQRSESARLENRDYAKSISSINVTIIFLNCALILVASLAAYMEAHGTITEDKIIDPAVAALEAETNKLYEELMSHRHKARTLDLEIQTHIARARYLSTASPTAEWEAKIERLNAVVPLFRTTNATVRGVDPQNILAFQHHRPIEFTPPELNALIEPKEELNELETEFKRLKQQLDFLRSDLLPGEVKKVSA